MNGLVHAHARELPHPPSVVRAAQWLVDNPNWHNGLRRSLREQFAIDDAQAAEAVALSNDMKILRRAHG